MKTADNVMSYGIAINFFGNYSKESKTATKGVTDFNNAVTQLTITLKTKLSKAYSVASRNVTPFINKLSHGYNKIAAANDRFVSSLFSLKNMLLGGGLVVGLSMLAKGIASVGLRMEQSFASIKTSLGTKDATLEALKWAATKAADTPFDIPDVNQALVDMARNGLAKTKEMREKVFNAIGDMAGAEGLDFGSGMYMFSKAAEGNWQQLAMRTGLRVSRMESMARQTSRTDEQKQQMLDYVKVLKKATVGSAEYKDALAGYLGIMYKGGMENRVKTVGGAFSNLSDLMSIFSMELVGYSQVQGSLFSNISKTIRDKILTPFDAVSGLQKIMADGTVKNIDKTTTLIELYKNRAGLDYKMLNLTADKIKANKLLSENELAFVKKAVGYDLQQITLKQRLFNIGKRVGNVLSIFWASIDRGLGGIVGKVELFIKSMDNWFGDFQGNVAPMIVWLTLIKLKILDFFSGFSEGFKNSFGFFIKTIKFVYKWVGKFFSLFSSEKANDIKGIGKAIGFLVGAMLGFKMFRVATSPMIKIISLTKTYIKMLKATIFWDRLSVKESNSKYTKQLRSMDLLIAKQIALNVVTSLNPVGLIVVAIIALVAWVAYLVTHWDEVRKKMQGVSDDALLLLSFFMPVVGIPLLLAKHWEKFKKIAINAWVMIKNVAIGVWNYVKYGFAQVINYIEEGFIIPIKNGIKKMWKGVKEFFKGFLDYMTVQFPGVALVFKKVGGWINTHLIDPIKKFWGYVKKIWDYIKTMSDSGFGSMLGLVASKSEKGGNASSNFALKSELLSANKTVGNSNVKELFMAKADTYKQDTVLDKIAELLVTLTTERKRSVVENINVKFPDKSGVTAAQFLDFIEDEVNKNGG